MPRKTVKQKKMIGSHTGGNERVTVPTQLIKARTGFEPGSESGTSAVSGFPVVSWEALWHCGSELGL